MDGDQPLDKNSAAMRKLNTINKAKAKDPSVPDFDKYLALNSTGNVAKESKTITSDINSFSTEKTSDIKMPDAYQSVMDFVLADSEIRAFYSILRDTVIRSGYTLSGPNKSKLDKWTKELKVLKFRKVAKRIVWDLLVYKHCFVEIQKGAGSNKVIGLKTLDPSKIRPVKDIHDKILFWFQYLEGIATADLRNVYTAGGIDAVRKIEINNQYVIAWEISEIGHLTIDESSYKFFGVTDVETLKDVIEIKDLALDHLKRLFKQGWFRVHFHGKNVGDNDIQTFLDMFATGIQDPDSPLVTVGSEDMEGKRYVYEKDVIEPIMTVLSEMRNKMLTLIRVPPIIAGTVDNSNRSNSDVQAHFALLNRVRAIQEDIEDDLPELFSKMGMEGLELNFSENANRDLREVMDVVAIMINLGSDPEGTMQWAKDKGYNLPVEVFKDVQPKVTPQLGDNSDLNPSRQPQDNSNKDGHKTESGVKTVNKKDVSSVTKKA